MLSHAIRWSANKARIQSDVLAPTSTVRETLTFAANLRLAENVPEEIKRERVFEVMTQLGLMDVADTRVGDGERRGISGGEARRVSIGIELIAAPEILILDEPTSVSQSCPLGGVILTLTTVGLHQGLDSVSAAKVISVLKGLTCNPNSPTTIIATIHQPSSALYQIFDTVLLLASGRQLYFGPGGAEPSRHFATLGLTCPEGYNTADHLLEIASNPPPNLVTGKISPIQRPSDSSDSAAKLVMSREEPSHSYTDGRSLEKGKATRNEESYEVPVMSKTEDSSYPPSHVESTSRTTARCATTFLTQLIVLSGREWRNLKR